MAETLQKWIREGKLSKAQLSKDGRSLTAADGVTLDASQTCQVALKGKSCRYTLASLFLQVLDPDQSLVAYRGVCKAHNVSDPVKALDKPVVMGYFLGTTSAAAAAAPPAASSDSAAAAAVAAKEAASPRKSSSDHRRRSSSSSDRHRHKQQSSSSSRGKPQKRAKQHQEHSHGGGTPEKRKKRHHHHHHHKGPMTNEQLFSNLNVVVDKRSSTTPAAAGAKEEESRDDQQLQLALSAEGFEVTPELLEEHRAALETILPLEIPVGNSASILRPITLEGRDFGRALELYMETTKATSSSSKQQQNNHKGSKKGPSTTPTSSSSTTKTYLIGKKPVIVLPKGMTSPITMINAVEFFGNARFVPRDVAKKQQQQQQQTNASSSSQFFVSRKLGARLGGGLVEYELMDNPKAKLGDDPREWQRIVAVIAMGAPWQFKDWPRKNYSDPVQLFSRVYGFYISMEGDKIPKDVEGWAVRRGKLNRDKRGLDSVTFASFWNGLDEWMAVQKPELLPKQQH